MDIFSMAQISVTHSFIRVCAMPCSAGKVDQNLDRVQQQGIIAPALIRSSKWHPMAEPSINEDINTIVLARMGKWLGRVFDEVWTFKSRESRRLFFRVIMIIFCITLVSNMINFLLAMRNFCFALRIISYGRVFGTMGGTTGESTISRARSNIFQSNC